MRNLKRALSLALASVMLLGMMVVGTSAASYPDVDSNDNVEAIEVLNAVKVMIGDRGNFKPDAPVNRHEMAVIMAKLVLGNEIADNYVGTHPFTDVASWADKYVAACYENGIAAGTSKTTFGGDKPLTAVEAAAFMLRALGYKDLSKGASDWSVPVTAKANEIRLFAGVAANPKQQLDRNQVAQLALNTLKSPVVDLKDGTFDITSGEGNVVISGGSREYIVRASTDSYAQAISDAENRGNSASGVGGYTIELGEHLYNGDLRLNNNATDDFGRPARQWEYNGKTIGTYAKTELLRAKYTEGVTGKTIYDLLGSSIVTGTNRYTFAIYMDGLDRTANSEIFPLADINRSNNSDLSGTGRGVLTEVFVDNDKDLVTISMTNTYLAKADADYSEKRDLASFDVYHLTKVNKNLIRAASNDTTSTVNLDAKGEDFLAAKDVKDGDIYLVTVADGKIQTLVLAEVISDTAVDAFSKKDFVEVAGTQYKYTKTTQYDAATLAVYTNGATTNLKDARYNVYLDAYKNAIGVKEIEAKKNYVFITGVDSNYSFLSATNYKVNAIFLDGTMETITIDAKKSSAFTNLITDSTPGTGIAALNKEAVVNTWCTYTKNSSNVYTVQPVSTTDVGSPSLMQVHDVTTPTPPATNITIDSKNYSLNGIRGGDFARVYANDETIFLTASVKDVLTEDVDNDTLRDILIDDVDSVVTGIDNVKIDVYTQAQAVAAAERADNVTHSSHRNFSYGSYVLFNDKGYILAAVVVGDDGGTNSEFVFVHKDDVVERDLGENKYQWTRTVLANGEEKVLTEIDDSSISYVERMDQNKWYRVTYKSDETVKSVTSFTLTAGLTYPASPNGTTDVQLDAANNGTAISTWGTLPSGSAATAKVQDIEDLIIKGAAGDEVVVYHERINDAKPTLNDKRTLHVLGTGYGTKDGIRIDENVKVWFKEFVDNKNSWDDGQNVNYLESVIKELKQDSNGTYDYDIAALIENGRATTVIIRDLVNDYNTPVIDNANIIGTAVSGNTTVEDINALLRSDPAGVTVTEPWTGAYVATKQLQIPAGKTLKFLSDLNLTNKDVNGLTKLGAGYTVATVGSGSHNLVVNGRFVTDDKVANTIGFDVTAKQMTFIRSQTDATIPTITVTGTINITGDGATNGNTKSADLVLEYKVTVDLKGTLIVNDTHGTTPKQAETYGGPDTKIIVNVPNGHAEINGTLRTTADVLTGSTLVATEPVQAIVTIKDDGTRPGRFTGTTAVGYPVIYKLSSGVAANNTIVLPALKAGAVVIADTANMKIQSVPAGVVLVAKENVTITGSIATKDIVIAGGRNLTLAANSSVVGDAQDVIKAANGTDIGNVGSTAAVISGGSNGAATTSDAKSAANDNKVGDGGKVDVSSGTTGNVNTDTTPATATLPITVAASLEEVTDLPTGKTQAVTVEQDGKTITVKVTEALKYADVKNAKFGGKTIESWFAGVETANMPTKLVFLKFTGNTEFYRFKADWKAEGYDDGVWVKSDTEGVVALSLIVNDKFTPMKVAFVGDATEKTVSNNGKDTPVFDVDESNVFEITFVWPTEGSAAGSGN